MLLASRAAPIYGQHRDIVGKIVHLLGDKAGRNKIAFMRIMRPKRAKSLELHARVNGHYTPMTT